MMAKFKGYVKTDTVRSKCDFEFEIDDEDIVNMDESEIEAYALQEAMGRIDWDFERV